MLTLTIESSCDETSAAVVRDGRELLSNAVASQIPVHRRYGGVVPEIASRNHIRHIEPVIREAIDDAGVSVADLEGVGVTGGPGLVGSLLVGIEAAKGFAFSRRIPCVSVNHLEGHLTTVRLELEGLERPEFPYLGFVVSGGHTDLFVVRGMGEYERIGRTRDDAAGEAFDKVGKMLGLPYPAGRQIDELAAEGDVEAYDFPRPMLGSDGLEMSFAGLKTAIHQFLEREFGEETPEGGQLRDICASFQQSVVDVLVAKTMAAADQTGLDRVVLSGGVAANSGLRAELERACEGEGRELFVAPPNLCTDNAGMFGPIAEHYLQQQRREDTRAGNEFGFRGHRIRARSSAAIG